MKAIHNLTPEQIAEWEREVRATGWPKNRSDLSDIKHGTAYAYNVRGCRCAPCAEAGHAAAERYQSKLRERDTE